MLTDIYDAMCAMASRMWVNISYGATGTQRATREFTTANCASLAHYLAYIKLEIQVTCQMLLIIKWDLLSHKSHGVLFSIKSEVNCRLEKQIHIIISQRNPNFKRMSHIGHINIWFVLSLFSKWSFYVFHDDIMTWKRFQHYWPFVRAIYRKCSEHWINNTATPLFNLRNI